MSWNLKAWTPEELDAKLLELDTELEEKTALRESLRLEYIRRRLQTVHYGWRQTHEKESIKDPLGRFEAMLKHLGMTVEDLVKVGAISLTKTTFAALCQKHDNPPQNSHESRKHYGVRVQMFVDKLTLPYVQKGKASIDAVIRLKEQQT